MNVRTLTVNHFTQKPLLCHIEGSNFEIVIHTVFEHHTVQACFFAHINKCPNLFHIKSSRHFYSYVFAVLHSVERHWGVVLPVGYDIHKVDVFALAKFFPSVFATGVLRHAF